MKPSYVSPSMMGHVPYSFQQLYGKAEAVFQDPELSLHAVDSPMAHLDPIYQMVPETNDGNNTTTTNNNAGLTPYTNHPGLATPTPESLLDAPPPDTMDPTALDATLCPRGYLDLGTTWRPWAVLDAPSLAPPSIPPDAQWDASPADWLCHLPAGYADPLYDALLDQYPAATPPPASPWPAATPFDPVPDLAISPLSSLTSPASASYPSPACNSALCHTPSVAAPRPRGGAQHPRRATPPAKNTHRTREDKILLDCRKRGMSYKKIREEHAFDVSESTLRGRHRALTKHSSQRPRKPLWTGKDIELLQEAVPVCTRQTGKTKVSWKDVSEYIYRRGGSHAFAYTTCRRKWCEVTGESV